MSVLNTSSRRTVAALALALAVGACAASPSAVVDTVSFSVSPMANDTTPVAIDVVSIRDEKLVETFGAMTAADWFAKREQTVRDHPTMVGIASWELVPGQKLTTKMPEGEPAWAILVFANYANPGPHRLRVPNTRTLTLTAGDKDIELVP